MENGTSITIKLKISSASAVDASVDVGLLGDFTTAVEGIDFTFTPATYTFPANSTAMLNINIPIIDNGDVGKDKLFVLILSNPVNCSIGSNSDSPVYILGDEEDAPVASKALQIEFAASYLVDPQGSAEIVAYSKAAKRLFVMNSTASKVEILDFSNPKNIIPFSTVDLSLYGSGGTSVACNNSIVAATLAGVNQGNGTVVFMDLDGQILSTVTAGSLPDMVTFTPDNHYVLVANEGEPAADYSIDPEGSISMIDISGGAENVVQGDVSTIDFHAYDDEKAALQAEGVRIFGLNSTVSQDFEPEFITVSGSSQKAWVTLQENNAVAVLNLAAKKVTDIIPLGVKNHNMPHNSADISDKNDSVFMSTWNLRGMYMPDAIGNYNHGGILYFVTANEGDQREYDGVNEDVKVKDAGYVLDPGVFPNASILKKDHLLGRLAVTPYSGDTDGDGDFDEIHSFGARSFSIWNGKTGTLEFDSGDDFEKITAADPTYWSLFNVSNDNNSFKNRSDNKGPEPEGLTLARIMNKDFAFVSLERTGGFITYDISNPVVPVFVDYQNNRALGGVAGGDLGPEGIIYINAFDSPVDTGLIVIANEISATISVYYIKNDLETNAVPLGNWALFLAAGLIIIFTIIRFLKVK
jgi:hypothetical protein